ncbi:hypothetical protein [Corynebacterium sputi]|uniref:GAP1-N2 domain-containing protein n=1 Tax=Corynebacterium sputi TaxID=489915 RepID=UPI00040CDC8A|nr:hypothetical protein [Corynebacterium sputi]
MTGTSMFTYASFSRAGATGGWSVGERAGDLTDAELRSLIEWVPTRLDSADPVPKYASAQEIKALPKRIAWSLAPWGTDHVLWTSAPAGEDSTGRAGNVFSRVWVFRASGTHTSGINPAGFLDSPSVQFPFGAREVNATLSSPGTAQVPVPGQAADVSAVWDRLQEVEDIDLQSLLIGLLDGVEAGRFVVLAGDRHRAGLLIAAMCAVSTPEGATDLTWSTMERARSLRRAHEHGYRVVNVPGYDLNEAREFPGALVIDLTREPEIGTYRGTPTRTSTDEIPASAWSALVQLWAYTRHESRDPDLIPATPERPWSVAIPVIRERQLQQEASDALLELFSRDDVPINLSALLTKDDLRAFLQDVLSAAASDSRPVQTVNRLDVLAKTGALPAQATDTVVPALLQAGLADLVLHDPISLANSTRIPEQAVRTMIGKLLTESPSFADLLRSGDGMAPELSDWLGLKDLASTRIAENTSSAPMDFCCHGREAALMAAMALGEISGATTADEPVDDNPWGDSEPVHRTNHEVEGWGGDPADDWGSLDQPAEAAPLQESRANRLAIPGITVAFGLNSLQSLIPEPSERLADIIRSAVDYLRQEDRHLLTEGPWHWLFDTPDASHNLPVEEVGGMRWQETSGSEECVTDIVDVELRRVSDEELSKIAQYPRLDWWGFWSREIWPGTTEPEMLGRSFEILLREGADRDPQLLHAQNAILAMGAATQLVEPASQLALVLPWWRYRAIGPERLEEIARISAGIVSHQRPDFREQHTENYDGVPEVVLQIGRAVMQLLPSEDADPRDRRRREHGRCSDRLTGRNTDRK